MNTKKLTKLLFILLVAVLGITGCGEKAASTSTEDNANKPIAVKVSQVTKTSVASEITLNGKVKPVEEVNITPKIAGKVESIKYAVGKHVKKGDVLFTLESKDIRLQVNQAEAALNVAKAGLIRTKGGAVDQQLSQLQNALLSAETNYNDAKLNYERTKSLLEAGAVSKQIYEGAENKFKVAEEQYKLAKSNQELTKLRINPENIAATEAQVKQAQAAYDIVKAQLDNTVITSPISGTVAANSVKVGEMVGGTGITMSIVNLDSAEVEIGVTEDIVNKIKVGQEVKVNVKAATDKTLKGIVASIAPVTNVKTQSYPVKIQISNDDGVLKGGMFAEIRLSIDKAENVLAVPISSIVDEQGKKVVYVVEGDVAKKRQISIGFSSEKNAQVIEGLKENDAVVVKGQNFLQDDSKVIIADK